MHSGLIVDEREEEMAAGESRTQRVKAWQKALERCRQKPSRKRVHGLRVSTLRLQAELERWMENADAEDPARAAVERWMRQAQALRKALKPVREVDVQLQMLLGLEEEGDARRLTVPVCSRTCRQQTKEMAERLKEKRKDLAHQLTNAVETRHHRLTRRCDELQLALGPAPARFPAPEEGAVQRLLARTAEEFPELSAANLHAFRKRVKRARYAAEGAAGNELAQRQAACLGRMQTVAGEWHDWQALAKRARRMLGKRDAGDGLATLLETVEEAERLKALSYCRRTMARLLRHLLTEELEALPPKTPAKRAESKLPSEQRRAG
ncbi:MAG TPA: CHAD domain-containing protein [Terracidiphilus sp.]|nr:CHAD domain-containing protein [Terracidiphilus sp.]